MSRTMVTLTREMQDDYGYNEAIKTLRTNILFCGSKVRVIMFTSSVPGEGKSDITLAAAQSMAQLGERSVSVSLWAEKFGRCDLRYQRRKYEYDFCRPLFS